MRDEKTAVAVPSPRPLRSSEHVIDRALASRRGIELRRRMLAALVQRSAARRAR